MRLRGRRGACGGGDHEGESAEVGHSSASSGRRSWGSDLAHPGGFPIDGHIGCTCTPRPTYVFFLPPPFSLLIIVV